MDSLRTFFHQHFSPGMAYQRLDGGDHAASGGNRDNPYNEPAALAACRTGDFHWLAEEIEKDPALVFRHYRSGRSGRMTSLLAVVAQEGHFEMAKWLIRHGAEVKQALDSGITPLYSAALSGRPEVIELLICHGAEVNRASYDGLTPLSVAADDGNLEVAERLIYHGAEVNRVSDSGSTPLHYAAESGRLEVAELLIRHGAEINRAMDNGRTPLSFAAQNGHLEVVELFIRHRADVNRASDDGVTPLYLAAQNGHTGIVKSLLEAGADPRKKWAIFKIWKFAVITKSPLTAAQIHTKDQAIIEMIRTAIKERKIDSANRQVLTTASGLSSYGTFNDKR